MPPTPGPDLTFDRKPDARLVTAGILAAIIMAASCMAILVR